MRFASVINRFDFFEGAIAGGLLIVVVMRVTAAAVAVEQDVNFLNQQA